MNSKLPQMDPRFVLTINQKTNPIKNLIIKLRTGRLVSGGEQRLANSLKPVVSDVPASNLDADEYVPS